MNDILHSKTIRWVSPLYTKKESSLILFYNKIWLLPHALKSMPYVCAVVTFTFHKISCQYKFVRLAHLWFNTFTPELVPVYLFCNKTRVTDVLFLKKKTSYLSMFKQSMRKLFTYHRTVWLIILDFYLSWLIFTCHG